MFKRQTMIKSWQLLVTPSVKCHISFEIVSKIRKKNRVVFEYHLLGINESKQNRIYRLFLYFIFILMSNTSQ